MSRLHYIVMIVFLSLGNFYALSGTASGNERIPLKISIMDGKKIAYQGHPKNPNHEVLTELLPSIMEDYSVQTSYHDVQSRKENGAWVNSADVVNEKPDLILVHWSSFKYADNIKYCYPDGNGEALQCAKDIALIIEEVFELLGNTTKVIIYSRSPSICTGSFKNGLFKLIKKNRLLTDSIGLISMSKSARKQSFYNRISQRDLRSLSLKLLGYNNSFKVNNDQGLCLLREL